MQNKEKSGVFRFVGRIKKNMNRNLVAILLIINVKLKKVCFVSTPE